MTSLSLEAIPVPLFIVDKSGQIIDFTPSVTKMFLPASDIADIIDKDSIGFTNDYLS
ncbi:PAS domain-containing protein [Priestia flexa]|uniref:PAS domain-containing protein n=2 Tax=Priestia flexa TaxID=86664 RepID=UPI001EF43AF8|nr:PAS domain-containing protein [Priestia flexa]MCG7312578.1 PAS domain-containing protein [Priestia flexa]WHX80704.1 PAS domain-containing protein [Priestia flexa]